MTKIFFRANFFVAFLLIFFETKFLVVPENFVTKLRTFISWATLFCNQFVLSQKTISTIKATKKIPQSGNMQYPICGTELNFFFFRGIRSALCVLRKCTVVFAFKCRLFSLCAHGQCRVYYIYHVEFHFRFRSLV